MKVVENRGRAAERRGKLENISTYSVSCVRPLNVPRVSCAIYSLRIYRMPIAAMNCVCVRSAAGFHVAIAVNFQTSTIIRTHSGELTAHIYTIHLNLLFIIFLCFQCRLCSTLRNSKLRCSTHWLCGGGSAHVEWKKRIKFIFLLY